MTTKVCHKCKEEKDVSNFWSHKSYKDGYRAECKSCAANYAKEWHQRPENRDRRNKKNRDRYDPSSKKDNRLKNTYGINLSEYQLMLEKQNNSCAICKSDKSGGNGDFYVDHNHLTGQIRGLLCHWCNFMIGQSREDIEILAAGIEYLKLWNGVGK